MFAFHVQSGIIRLTAWFVSFWNGNTEEGVSTMKTLGIVKGALLTKKQRSHLARRLDGKSVLEWVVRQMTDCLQLHGVVVVADAGIDGDHVRELTPIDVPVFSTEAQDTLEMLQKTMETFSMTSCVLIGADWPFWDPSIIDQLIRLAETSGSCDYAAYQFMNEVFSPGRPYGLFPEWYRSETLRKVAKIADDPIHRQLPGTFFLDNQKQYNVELLPVPAGLDQQDLIRFTFDDEADWDDILDLHDALDLEVLDIGKIGRLLKNRTEHVEFAMN